MELESRKLDPLRYQRKEKKEWKKDMEKKDTIIIIAVGESVPDTNSVSGFRDVVVADSGN